eukprot:CAMPEP_0184118624 /NCGR_PEP_ID=MMETSP0974-20121125/21537_1 /TAXON_ID=483370 /ORGANISM="non described non described, Strain CCMP2097" /LENGTH=39 /DNA_ID= /DNA_START= /DNA_END= /DNA_ORIENTATION=
MIAVASTSAQRSGWNLSASWKKRFFTCATGVARPQPSVA